MTTFLQTHLDKHIRAEDGFIIRAAKCAGAFMEQGFDTIEPDAFSMKTIMKDTNGDYAHMALHVETNVFEFIDVLLESFINSVEPHGDGSTDISVEQGDEDLRYLCRVYEREKAKGLDTGYTNVTFHINRNSSYVKLETTGDFELTVGNLSWIGTIFATA